MNGWSFMGFHVGKWTIHVWILYYIIQWDMIGYIDVVCICFNFSIYHGLLWFEKMALHFQGVVICVCHLAMDCISTDFYPPRSPLFISVRFVLITTRLKQAELWCSMCGAWTKWLVGWSMEQGLSTVNEQSLVFELPRIILKIKLLLILP